MKRVKSLAVLYFSFFFLIAIGAEASSTIEIPAIKKIEMGGTMQLRLGVGVKPAGDTNQSELELDRLLVDIGSQLSPRRSFAFQVEGGRQVNSSQQLNSDFQGMAMRIKKAYLGFEKEWHAGLIPNPWINHHNSTMQLWRLGIFGDSTEEQYDLDTVSDLGISYSQNNESTKFSLAAFNGSGLGREEKGVAKDFQVFISHRMGDLELTVAHTLGLYDNLPQKIAKKNRTRVGLNTEIDSLQIYLFHIFAEDNSVLAQGKFLGAHIEQVQDVIHSRGYGGFLRLRFLENHSLFHRYVHWDVEKRYKGNELIHQIVGWHFDDGVQWGLSWVQKSYGRLFHKGVSRPDTEESVQLTAALNF